MVYDQTLYIGITLNNFIVQFDRKPSSKSQHLVRVDQLNNKEATNR